MSGSIVVQSCITLLETTNIMVTTNFYKRENTTAMNFEMLPVLGFEWLNLVRFGATSVNVGLTNKGFALFAIKALMFALTKLGREADTTL